MAAWMSPLAIFTAADGNDSPHPVLVGRVTNGRDDACHFVAEGAGPRHAVVDGVPGSELDTLHDMDVCVVHASRSYLKQHPSRHQRGFRDLAVCKRLRVGKESCRAHVNPFRSQSVATAS
jgi:hypothetical protein